MMKKEVATLSTNYVLRDVAPPPPPPPGPPRAPRLRVHLQRRPASNLHYDACLTGALHASYELHFGLDWQWLRDARWMAGKGGATLDWQFHQGALLLRNPTATVLLLPLFLINYVQMWTPPPPPQFPPSLYHTAFRVYLYMTTLSDCNRKLFSMPAWRRSSASWSDLSTGKVEAALAMTCSSMEMSAALKSPPSLESLQLSWYVPQKNL